MQVTEHGEHGMPTAGIILAHGPTRKSIQQEILGRVKPGQVDQPELYVFSTQSRIRSRTEWSNALDELVQKEIAGGRVGD